MSRRKGPPVVSLGLKAWIPGSFRASFLGSGLVIALLVTRNQRWMCPSCQIRQIGRLWQWSEYQKACSNLLKKMIVNLSKVPSVSSEDGALDEGSLSKTSGFPLIVVPLLLVRHQNQGQALQLQGVHMAARSSEAASLAFLELLVAFFF